MTLGASQINDVTSTPLGSGSVTTLTPSVLSHIDYNGQFVGVAFAASGQLAVETSGLYGSSQNLYLVNVDSGAVGVGTAETGTTGGVLDLASCSYPTTLTVEKDIASRYVHANSSDPVDEFALSVTGPGITSGNTGTTTGDTTGLQSGSGEIAGPVVVHTGTSYKVSETAGNPTTNMGDYSTTYSCRNAEGVVTSGSGQSFSYDPATSGEAVTCVFTNTAAPGTIYSITKTASVTTIAPTTTTGTTADSWILTPTVSGTLTGGESVTFSDPLPTYNGDFAYGTVTQSASSTQFTSCAISSGTLTCTYTVSSSVTSEAAPTFAAVTVNFTVANDAPTGTISNTASFTVGSGSPKTSTAKVAVTQVPAAAPKTSSSTTVVPSPAPPKPVTSSSSTVVVPLTHTGEPWSGNVWWILFGGLGALGGAIVTDGYRRKRRTA